MKRQIAHSIAQCCEWLNICNGQLAEDSMELLWRRWQQFYYSQQKTT